MFVVSHALMRNLSELYVIIYEYQDSKIDIPVENIWTTSMYAWIHESRTRIYLHIAPFASQSRSPVPVDIEHESDPFFCKGEHRAAPSSGEGCHNSSFPNSQTQHRETIHKVVELLRHYTTTKHIFHEQRCPCLSQESHDFDNFVEYGDANGHFCRHVGHVGRADPLHQKDQFHDCSNEQCTPVPTISNQIRTNDQGGMGEN